MTFASSATSSPSLSVRSHTFGAALTSFITASVVTYPVFLRRPWVLVSVMLAGFLVPVAFEAAGAMTSTWVLVDGGILVRGHAMRLEGALAIGPGLHQRRGWTPALPAVPGADRPVGLDDVLDWLAQRETVSQFT